MVRLVLSALIARLFGRLLLTAYGTPTDPVAGTVITVAYAVANLLDPIRALRAMTGGDAPGTNLPLVATSTTTGAWQQLTADGIADNAVTTAKILNANVTEAKLADNAVTTGKINSGAVTTDRLDTDAVTEAKLADNAVSTDKIVATAVTEPKLADGAVTAGKIGNGQVTNAKLDAGAVTAAKITNGEITDAKMAANTLTAASIAPNAIGSSELADGAVDTAAIGDGQVTEAKLASDSVTSAKIAANAVGASELADNAVDAAAIVDGAVTYAKAAAAFFLAPTEDTPSADYSLTNAFADVTGASVTTTRAGTYAIFLHVAFTNAGLLTTGVQFKARIQRTGSGTANSQEVPSIRVPAAAAAYEIASAIVVLTAPVAGDVFRLQALDTQASNSVEKDYTWFTPVWIAP